MYSPLLNNKFLRQREHIKRSINPIDERNKNESTLAYIILFLTLGALFYLSIQPSPLVFSEKIWYI